jgi:hypothetical protein
MSRSVEPLSDHPLFRALVLMGGGLTMGCGGVAQQDSPLGVDVGGAGAPSGGGSGGGATSIGSSGNPSYDPACPYAQWDCSSTGIVGCSLSLSSPDNPKDSGCVCDTSRPTSARACGPDETFVCLQAFPHFTQTQQQAVGTWDGSLHVQCACLPSPKPSYDSCSRLCSSTYPNVQTVDEEVVICFLPADSTCDANGVCTATSADVLRQDGIMCGCGAFVGLK